MNDSSMVQNALLSDLAGFPDPGLICSDTDILEAAAHLQRKSLLKKWQPDGQSRQAIAAAQEKFLGINGKLDPNCHLAFHLRTEDSYFLDYLMGNLWSALEPSEHPADVNLSFDFLKENLASGPGASLGSNGDDFYTKHFAGPLTYTTPYLLMLYRAAVDSSDIWAAAERRRFEKFGARTVEGNKLFFVPKTTEISRSCCTEPSVNMMFQKAVGAFIEARLKREFGIDLSTQPRINRMLAREGSIDGLVATIDLASASDSMNWSLLQLLLPPDIAKWLRLTRCDYTILPNGEKVRLQMVSTMGNGFTFPLQTLLFSCVLKAVYQLHNLKMENGRNFGVFGDDIICLSGLYDSVCRYLSMLGFTVNGDKSFAGGLFRESCGEDYFHGVNVRGVFLTSLRTVSETYSAINRFNEWSGRTGIPLNNTVQYLLSRLDKKPFLVPRFEADHVGVRAPFVLTRPQVTDSYWFAYRRLEAKVNRVRVPDDAEEAIRFGWSHFDEDGLAIARLGGYVSRPEYSYVQDGDKVVPYPEPGNASFTRRAAPGSFLRTRVGRSACPYWDWPGLKDGDILPHRVWEDAVTANLSGWVSE